MRFIKASHNGTHAPTWHLLMWNYPPIVGSTRHQLARLVRILASSDMLPPVAAANLNCGVKALAMLRFGAVVPLAAYGLRR